MTAICQSEGLRGGWYAVASSSDVSEQPLAVTLLGDRFVLWRSGDVLSAAPDRCPHREAPLSAGSVKDGRLICLYHGWAFSGDGQCVAVPSSPDPKKVPARGRLKTCEVREAYGLVWLCPGMPTLKFPEIVEDRDSGYHRLNIPIQRWNVAATRMVDNFMDSAHFPFVHANSIGAGIDPVVAPIEMEQLDEWFTGYRYDTTVANPPEGQALNGAVEPVITNHLTTGFCLPTTVRGTFVFQNGTRQVLLMICTPVDEEISLFTFVLWRSSATEPAEEVVAFELKIIGEDRAMLEQLNGSLPLNPGALIAVASDKGSEAWRREFTKLVNSTPANARA